MRAAGTAVALVVVVLAVLAGVPSSGPASAAGRSGIAGHAVPAPAAGGPDASGPDAGGPDVDGSGIGSPGVGDPYLPNAGNGGYHVRHYDLMLRYDPGSGVLAGTATISATTDARLRRFDLDLRGLTVRAVTVAGVGAGWARSGQELVITPAAALAAGADFEVRVDYGGRPEPVSDGGLRNGWLRTGDGVFVAGEPDGAATWFPCDDHPSDKATYTVTVSTPDSITVLGNGIRRSSVSSNGTTTVVWEESHPMATYLATITMGHFDVSTTTTDRGLPVLLAVDPSQHDGDTVLARLPAVVDLEEDLFGPYPFEAVGAIVDDAPDVGFALETQTKPIYSQAPDLDTLVHETAHQWFGDSVSVADWSQIWLNEGFATYAEWLYHERTGGPSAQQQFDHAYARPADDGFWHLAPGDPGAPTMFDGAVYQRGAMTLQALRGRIGDPAFFTVLRRWAAEHRDGNARTSDFVALAEQVAGRDLHPLFDTWLSRPAKPVTW
jgi:aminopeptidase N